MSPSADLAEKARKALEETLGIKYTGFVIADRYARETIRGMTPVMMDEKALRMLILGLLRLLEKEWSDLVENFVGRRYQNNFPNILQKCLGKSPILGHSSQGQISSES
jgi:hypothetical protein